MSRAFVKETDRDEAITVPPLALPPGAVNRITPEGAARLRAELTTLLAERARLRGDDRPETRPRASSVAARIALLESRAPTWVETPCPPGPPTCVFGAVVTLADPDGRERVLRVVGIDEAEPAEGRVSWLSPIAQAVLGAAVGDTVHVRAPRGEEELEVVGIVGG